MNARLHSVLKYLYVVFLLASGIKHLYNIYWGDASQIAATGYPSPEATLPFVFAVLETKFCSLHLHRQADCGCGDTPLPGREQLGVLMAFPYAVGMLM